MFTVQQRDFIGVWHPILTAQRDADAFHYFKGLQQAHGKDLHRVVETF